MSFDASLRSQTALYFIKIELDGQTLRYASEDCQALDEDGILYFWEGRILNVSNLSVGFNDFISRNVVVSNIIVNLANGLRDSNDSNLDAAVASEFWGNKKVTIYVSDDGRTSSHAMSPLRTPWRVGTGVRVGPSRRVSSSLGGPLYTGYVLKQEDIVFRGKVRFPDGIIQHTEDRVDIQVVDDRVNSQLLLTPNAFIDGPNEDNSTFDGLDPSIEGQTIPIIYGDYSNEAIIFAYPIRGFKGGDIHFKISDPEFLGAGQKALKSIDRVVNDRIVEPDGQDLDRGEFLLEVNNFTFGNLTYVACKGKTRGTQIASVFGGDKDDLLEHPVEIIYDLLVNALGVATSDINETNFLSYYNDDTTLKAKAYINIPMSVVLALNEIAFEFGFDLYALKGKFEMSRLDITKTTAEYKIDESDIMLQSYKTAVDRNQLYANRLDISYNLDASQLGRKIERIRNDQKRSEHGFNQTLKYLMTWNHEPWQIQNRFSEMMFIMSQPIEVVEFSVPNKMIYAKPNDVIDFTFHKFTNHFLVIRQLIHDLKTFTTKVVCWNFNPSDGSVDSSRLAEIKDYATDAQTDPTDYSDADSATYAVYHATSEIVAGFNDKLTFTTDAEYTATLNPGVYSTVALFAAEIQRAMNATGTSKAMSVDYDATNRKFTISTDDSSNFELNWTSNTELGQSSLGFDISTDDTGAATYTSDELCIFDLVRGEAVSQWG